MLLLLLLLLLLLWSCFVVRYCSLSLIIDCRSTECCLLLLMVVVLFVVCGSCLFVYVCYVFVTCLFVCPFPNPRVVLKVSRGGVICCSLFVVVVVVVCCVVLCVASNPLLLFNIVLLVVVAVGVRGLLCVCVCLLFSFLCLLRGCLFVFVRSPILECRSKFVYQPGVLFVCRWCWLLLCVVNFVVVVVVFCGVVRFLILEWCSKYPGGVLFVVRCLLWLWS